MVSLVFTVCIGPDQPRGEVRARTTHRHLEGVRRLQRLFERFGVTPTYLLGFPALLQGEESWFGELHARNACEIGAYFEPWSTPPFGANENRLSARTLAETQQSAIGNKLRRLSETFVERLGIQPICHRSAGFGLTGSALQALEGLGYKIDSSILPLRQNADGAPGVSAQQAPRGAYFPDRQRPRSRGASRVLEIPVTMGWPRRSERALARVGWPMGREPTLLDPSRSQLPALRGISDYSIQNGYSALVVHLKSNTLFPGCSARCPTAEDVEEVFARIDQYLRYAVDEARTTPTGLIEFAQNLSS